MLFSSRIFIRTANNIKIVCRRHAVQATWKHFYSTLARPDIDETLKMDQLPKYNLPQEIYDIESGEKPTADLQDKLTKWTQNKSTMRSNESDYIESLRMMINFEEAAEQIQNNTCSQQDIKLIHVDDNEFFFEIEPRMKNMCTFVKQFDRFRLRSKDDSTVYDGEIILKLNTKIYIELNDLTDELNTDELYDICFDYNPIFYHLQHQALDFVQRHRLFDILINNSLYHEKSDTSKQIDLNDSSIIDDLNEEQIKAVNKICAGKYYPLPYLLYGPPGTGKTKTLITAIKNILTTSNKNILICAQSNAACDEITNRLSKFLNRNEMFRLYSKSKDLDIISRSIKNYSNLFGDELKYPPLDYLYKYRVIICTLAMAGCLVRAKCKPDHFSYIMIDECGSAHETAALIPIAGLCTSKEKVHAKIVLAGDPKQLDAVTKSEWATKLGFGVSWLEKLFNMPLYARDTITGQFNSNYITQLVKNYRSHPTILHVPNELFYDGSLEPKICPHFSDLNINLPALNPKCSILFKSIQGQCVKPEYDTSSYNVEEAVEIVNYVRLLLKSSNRLRQKDIGIVSPYRLQCEMIRLSFKSNGLHDISVGTAEKFQGQERKIIIASTVCSNSETLGSFVSDAQRLNVMITRAQHLLIIVGDPHTLKTDLNWLKLITYCYEHENLIQSDVHFMPEK